MENSVLWNLSKCIPCLWTQEKEKTNETHCVVFDLRDQTDSNRAHNYNILLGSINELF